MKYSEYLFVFKSSGKNPVGKGMHHVSEFQTVVLARTAEDALKKLEEEWSFPSVIYVNNLTP